MKAIYNSSPKLIPLLAPVNTICFDKEEFSNKIIDELSIRLSKEMKDYLIDKESLELATYFHGFIYKDEKFYYFSKNKFHIFSISHLKENGNKGISFVL